MEDESKSAQRPFASAAMVELKAELSRKREQFQREKASNTNTVKGIKLQKVSLKKKANVWDQKNAGVSGRAQKDLDQTEEEENENALLKSKLILERKSQIYDAISSSGNIPEEDGNEGYLVDFQKKYVDDIVQQREMKRRLTLEEEEEEEAQKEPIPEAENSDEEWVDYTDSLGRSKRCMRKDLKDLQKKDQDLAVSANHRKSGQEETLDGKDGHTEPPHQKSDDMYREKMRQKWEDEARQLLEKGQEEIHYANVQFDEIRTHGVGFYQFSKDQEEREAQMEKLNKLRDETKTERSRTEMIKDKRKALMEARLAKVRDRRKLKTKETPPADKDTDPKPSEADVEEQKKADEAKRVKEEAEKAAEETRKKFIREWDKTKVASSWKGDGYVESRRQEREAEFAPPSIYFNNTDYGNKQMTHVGKKIFPQSFRSKNNKNEDDKSFYETSSGLTVSESNAKTTRQMSKATAIHPSSAPSSDTLPRHSIPLPSDVKGTSKNTGLNSDIPKSHHNFQTYKVVKPHHNGSPTGNMQSQMSSMQKPSKFIGAILQQQWSVPQGQHSCSPQQWSQHQYFPHQLTQPQAAGHSNSSPYYQNQTPVYADPNHTALPGNIKGVKRMSVPETDAQTSASNVPKKPKVPKSAILDNRFVLNSEAAQPSGDTIETGSLLTVQAVPYQPGSFTDAKFKLGTSPSDKEPPPLSRGKSQISGGPLLYTKEQRQQQLLQMENEGADSEEVKNKVEEFLKSVQNEMT